MSTEWNKYNLSDDQSEIESFNSSFFSFFKDPKSFKTFKDFSYVLKYLKQYKKRLRLSIFLFFMSFSCTLLIPRAIGFLVDQIFQDRDVESFKLIYLFMGLYCFKIFFECCYKWSFAKLGERILRNLREDINKVLEAIPMKFYDLNSSGKIISRAVNDVTNFALIFNPMMYHTIGDTFLIFGSLAILIYTYPLAGLLMTVLVLFLFITLFRFSLLIGRKLRKKRSLNSKVNTFISDSINGLELIYANGYIEKFHRSYSRIVRLYYLSSEKIVKTWGKFPSIHAFVLGFVFAFISIYFGGLLATNEITKGEFVSLIFYSSMAFLPFNDIASRQNEFQDGMSSMSKIKEILSLKNSLEFKDNPSKKSIDLSSASISFEKVSFSYDNDQFLFKDLNLTIPANKVTAVIGRTGSGKTSLISLITRLYNIQKGKIKLGDYALTEIPLADLYEKVGVVTQQLFLFKDAIRENLRLYNKEISDEKIWEVLDSLDLRKRVESFENGLDTPYNETNQMFSTGEKQLIVIGRMILKNPSILIFDEATANLDNLMENKVQQSLAKLLPGRTTIVIAHRLSTIQMAKNIIVFANGEVVEQGEPSELLALKKHYYSYYREAYR